MTVKRKILLILLVLFILGSTIIFFTAKKFYTRKAAKTRLHALKQLPIVGLDSTGFNTTFFSRGKNIIIVYINPDCQPCRDQATELQRGVDRLVDSSILFISSESIDEIERFSIELNLNSFTNIHLSKINENDVFTVFGSVVTPQVFLYDKEGKLLQQFKGVVSVETITNYLE